MSKDKKLSVKELREKSGYSQAKAAVTAQVAINTWARFELLPEAVTPNNRAKCEVVVALMRKGS